MNEKEEIRKLYFWIILSAVLAGIAALVSSIAVLILVLRPVEVVQSAQQNQEKDLALLHEEITFRFEEIRSLLDHEPLISWQLRNATSSLTSHGVGVSERYIDTELKTLLFELEQI